MKKILMWKEKRWQRPNKKIARISYKKKTINPTYAIIWPNESVKVS